MNKLTDKPHLIFLITVPVLILIGFLSGDSVLSVNHYDTYYVISYFDIAILISGILGLIGLLYLIRIKFKKIVSKKLTAAHIVLTFGGSLLGLAMVPFYSTHIWDYQYNQNLTFILRGLLSIILLGQVIFPINLIFGLVKRKGI